MAVCVIVSRDTKYIRYKKGADDETTFSGFKHLDRSYFIGKSTSDLGEGALTIKFIQDLTDYGGKAFLARFLDCAAMSPCCMDLPSCAQ
jgi:hypothetical protein